jgi:hypothetical protein
LTLKETDMSDEQKIVESALAGQKLVADQWYAIRVQTFARRTATGRLETRGFTMKAVKVDSPDAPMPPEGGEGGEPDNTLPETPPAGTAEPKA